ncbi:MAG: hypothetical protein ACTSR3_05870 [Candidatus Helarchaeota archaeon]
MLVAGLFAGMAFVPTKVVEVEKPVVTEKVVEIEKECPACPVCPEVDSDELRSDFYRDYFEDEYTEIEEHAEEVALNELEDDDYEVITDYIETLLSEGEELEDDVDVDIEDTEIEVTKLGLDEDEDKVAIVTFELEVEYELEEGIRDKYEKDLIAVYKVTFDEGDFEDEEVKLISLN